MLISTLGDSLHAKSPQFETCGCALSGVVWAPSPSLPLPPQKKLMNSSPPSLPNSSHSASLRCPRGLPARSPTTWSWQPPGKRPFTTRRGRRVPGWRDMVFLFVQKNLGQRADLEDPVVKQVGFGCSLVFPVHFCELGVFQVASCVPNGVNPCSPA